MTAMIAQEQNQVRKLNLAFLSGYGVRTFDEQGAVFAKGLCGDAVLQIRERLLQPLFRMVDDEARFGAHQKTALIEDLRQK